MLLLILVLLVILEVLVILDILATEGILERLGRRVTRALLALQEGLAQLRILVRQDRVV